MTCQNPVREMEKRWKRERTSLLMGRNLQRRESGALSHQPAYKINQRKLQVYPSQQTLSRLVRCFNP